MKTAHYFAGAVKYVVFGLNGKFSFDAPKHTVTGKVEARKLAATSGATPWNF